MEIRKLTGCRRRIEVEVPAETVREEMEKASQRMSRTVQLPGFRKGKAPVSLVRRQFGKELRQEVINRLIREYTGKVIEEKQLRPVHDPVLEGYTLGEESLLRFRAVFDVYPEVRLGQYKGLPVSPPDLTVKPEAMEAALRSLQRRSARYLPVEGRPVGKGDFVVGRLSGKFLEETGGEIPERTVTLEVSDPEVLPELRAALVGMETGQERTVTVTFPEDHPDTSRAGKGIEYRFHLREIKQLELPLLDDDLAREIGSFDTLKELEETVRKRLRESAEAEWKRSARRGLLDRLLDIHTLDLPESLVELETRSRVGASLRERDLRQWDPSGASELLEEEKKRQRPLAERGVKAMLLLDAIARREGISVSMEEINERLRTEAGHQGRTLASLKEEISQKGSWNELERSVLREKVLDFLLGNANIS